MPLPSNCTSSSPSATFRPSCAKCVITIDQLRLGGALNRNTSSETTMPLASMVMGRSRSATRSHSVVAESQPHSSKAAASAATRAWLTGARRHAPRPHRQLMFRIANTASWAKTLSYSCGWCDILPRVALWALEAVAWRW